MPGSLDPMAIPGRTPIRGRLGKSQVEAEAEEARLAHAFCTLPLPRQQTMRRRLCTLTACENLLLFCRMQYKQKDTPTGGVILDPNLPPMRFNNRFANR